MADLLCAHFLRHTDVAKFVNTAKLVRANVLKIDTDSASGGWVMWYYAGGSLTNTLYARHFQRHTDLTAFVNAEGLVANDILKIDADQASGGWTIFWYA